VQFGAWYDHQTNHRTLYDIDFSNDNAFDYDLKVPPGALPEAAYIDRLQENQLFSREAYVQYVWHVIQGLDITAGDQYVDFERAIHAPVNQTTELPVDYDKNWTRDLPSVDVHYKFADNWAAYAQYAKGFLAPNLNTFYVPNPQLNRLSPEATTNVQAGATWAGQPLTISADVYTKVSSCRASPWPWVAHIVKPAPGGRADSARSRMRARRGRRPPWAPRSPGLEASSRPRAERGRAR
jgi:iron complex outermembrane recepter protein